MGHSEQRSGRATEGQWRGEFIANDFKEYCHQMGVLLEYTCTNTPQRIGLSKLIGRSLAAMILCILTESNLLTIL